MITHNFKNGETDIRVESAESLEDAKKNGFPEGIYSRFFYNYKPITNYQAMIRLIVEETQRSGKRFIPPTHAELKKMQREALQRQNEEMKKQYEKLKAEYKTMGAPEVVLKQIDEAIDKIDIAGVRVVE